MRTARKILLFGNRSAGPAALVDSGPYDIARQEEYTSASGTSIATTLRQTPVDGNLLVCCFGGKVSDANLTGPGAGWTKAISRQASGSLAAGIWYRIASGDSATITCTSGAAAPLTMHMREYEGVSASPLDVTVSNSSATGVTTLNLGTTGATAQADELAIAMVFTNDTLPLRFASWSNGFDEVMSPSLGNPKMYVANKVLSATGAVTVTPSWAASNAATGMIATFKLSAAPTRPAMPVRRLASGTYFTTENTGLTRTSRSFTPSANRLIICLYGISNDSGLDIDTTIAPSHGGALNWTVFGDDREFNARRVHFAYAWSATEPGAGTIEFTFPQVNDALWYSVIEIGGVDLSAPITQMTSADAGVSDTEIDITQPVAPAATSTMVGIVLHGAFERHLHEAGYHIIEEGKCADMGQTVSAFWYPGADQTAHLSWATNIHAIAIVAEIKRAP